MQSFQETELPSSTFEGDAKDRILIVDDTRSIHDDFRKILGSRNQNAEMDSDEALLFGTPEQSVSHNSIEIDSAYQGQEALAMVEKAMSEKRPYTLAFVDVRMPPGWDGIRTIEHLWKADPNLQVVICTAYSDYSWNDIMQRFGRTDSLLILRKPFDIIEVQQLTFALVQKWKLTRQARLTMTDLEAIAAKRTRQSEHSASLLRATLESTADGIAVVDLGGRVVSYNQKFLHIWNIPEELAARRDASLLLNFVMDQLQDLDLFLARLEELNKNHEIVGLDSIALKSGRIIERYSQPQILNGEIVGRVWSFRDITARHRAEKRNAAFSILGRQLSEASSQRRAAEIIVQVADDLFGWDSCYLNLYSPETDVITSVFNADVIDGKRQVSEGIEYEAPTPHALRIIKEGKELLLRNDAESGSSLTSFGDNSRRSASLMFVPIRIGTNVVGVLSIQSYRPNAYCQNDLEALQNLADHCGGALERIRIQEALIASSAKQGNA